MRRSMLSTSDNPYNPFTHFREWFAFDSQKGYHSLSYLGRVALTSDQLSQDDDDEAVEDAIEQIVELNPLGIYVRIFDPNISNPPGEGSREKAPLPASPAS